jgi:hypothetical protein
MASPKMTLETYADLFNSDLDALADVLDQARTAALSPSTANGVSESAGKNRHRVRCSKLPN